MKFNVYYKEYKNEIGELSENFYCNEVEIMNLINDSWKNNNQIYDVEAIIIRDDLNFSFIIKHFAKEIFDFYFLQEPEELIFHRKTNFDITLIYLDKFLKRDIRFIRENLIGSKKDFDYIKNYCLKKDFHFRLPGKLQISHFVWLIPAVTYSLFFYFFSIILFLKVGTILWPLNLIFILFGTYTWLPGVLLHWNYYHENINLEIQLSKGNNDINIKFFNKTIHLHKFDIEKITQYINTSSNRNPWADYGYTEIRFKRGEIINITNLLMDQLDILDKFKSINIDKKRKINYMPFIRQKAYFI